MKKRLAFLLLPCLALSVHAQNALTVNAGTTLYVSPTTILHVEGLTLVPSSAFTLNGVNLVKATAASNPGISASIARAYQFSTTTAPFTGTIRLAYQTAEMGSQNENGLLVRMHSGTAWGTAGGTVRNSTTRYVEGTATANTLRELTLSSSSILPLVWKSVGASRRGQSVVVEWATFEEVNTAQFAVERSAAGSWQVVADSITARNTAGLQHYTYTDTKAPEGRLLYRIRQADRDGRFTYSATVAVGGTEAGRLRVYPNPVAQTFWLQPGNPTAIQAVQLYNSAGVFVKAWPGGQVAYTLPPVAAGVYRLSVLTINGQQQQLSFIKQ